MRTGNLPANMKKNRVLQIIPCKEFSDTLNCSIIHHNLLTSKFCWHVYGSCSVPDTNFRLNKSVGAIFGSNDTTEVIGFLSTQFQSREKFYRLFSLFISIFSLFASDDFNRVMLSVKRGQEFTDYINASFIDVSRAFLAVVPTRLLAPPW